MKLKESTFAIIAEKQNSISHKWFEQNANGNHKFAWGTDKEWTYLYNKGNWDFYKTRLVNKENYPICTELEFEALLKSEQENEASRPLILNTKSITVNRAPYPKNTAFGSENIAHKHLNENAPTTPKQITISYNLALEYIAERLNVDKGIIKIEMP